MHSYLNSVITHQEEGLFLNWRDDSTKNIRTAT